MKRSARCGGDPGLTARIRRESSLETARGGRESMFERFKNRPADPDAPPPGGTAVADRPARNGTTDPALDDGTERPMARRGAVADDRTVADEGATRRGPGRGKMAAAGAAGAA